MARSLPLVENPKNRFDATYTTWDVEALEDIPRATLHVYEDRSKSILATNDSPDVGFRWSVNPYRGCTHACSYCLDGDAAILMADGTQRALRDVRVGDEIVGTQQRGAYRRFARARVLAHWQTVKPAVRVTLSDATTLIASPDHRFLTRRGWKHVLGAEHGPNRRPRLTPGTTMLGIGALPPTPPISEDYELGYLTGMLRGDGHLGSRHDARLAVVDVSALLRTRGLLARHRTTTTDLLVSAGTTTRQADVASIRELVAWPTSPTAEWLRGFLGGIFDAEGSYSRGVLRISNAAEDMLEHTLEACRQLGFDAVLEPARESGVRSVRVRGGLGEHLRFFQVVDPAIRRKCDVEGEALKHRRTPSVVAVEPLDVDMLMFDITTTTGDFIANGVVSHNCYARPTHEYLSLGAGTDFERKIVAKPEAATLLREAFEKKSWKGELVVMSGVTDCYQPLEGKMRLTRGLLEVCLEYRNPVGIITKSPLVERDVDLLAELADKASARVSVSIPFWKKDIARAMEPNVTTPERRMRIVERLAKAGVPVGVSVSPIIPGLNDEDIGEVLEAAKDAGATHAFYVLLRLPGAVKDVFEERLRRELPLRADRVMNRVRETRGGKLYDTRWASRGTGEGVYADMISALFDKTTRRLGLRKDDVTLAPEAASTFRRPDRAERAGQRTFGF